MPWAEPGAKESRSKVLPGALNSQALHPWRSTCPEAATSVAGPVFRPVSGPISRGLFLGPASGPVSRLVLACAACLAQSLCRFASQLWGHHCYWNPCLPGSQARCGEGTDSALAVDCSERFPAKTLIPMLLCHHPASCSLITLSPPHSCHLPHGA